MGADNVFGTENFNPDHRKITIELKDGRWLVNNKAFQDLSEWEKDFMNKFFQEIRIDKMTGL